MELTGTAPRGYIHNGNGVPMTNLELTMEHTIIEDDYKRKVSCTVGEILCINPDSCRRGADASIGKSDMMLSGILAPPQNTR
jgi:hypothetical protein